MPKITRESLRLDGYNIFNLGLSSNFAVRRPVTKLKKNKEGTRFNDILFMYVFDETCR